MSKRITRVVETEDDEFMKENPLGIQEGAPPLEVADAWMYLLTELMEG